MPNTPKMLLLPIIPPDDTNMQRRLRRWGNTGRKGFENILEDTFFVGGLFFSTLWSVKEPAYLSLTRLESRVREMNRRREETWAFLLGALVLLSLIL